MIKSVKALSLVLLAGLIEREFKKALSAITPSLPANILRKYSSAEFFVISSPPEKIVVIRVFTVAKNVEISFSTSIAEYFSIIGIRPSLYESLSTITQSLSISNSAEKFNAGFEIVQIVGR